FSIKAIFRVNNIVLLCRGTPAYPMSPCLQGLVPACLFLHCHTQGYGTAASAALALCLTCLFNCLLPRWLPQLLLRQPRRWLLPLHLPHLRRHPDGRWRILLTAAR